MIWSSHGLMPLMPQGGCEQNEHLREISSKLLLSGIPEIRTSRNADIWTSGYPDIRISGYPDILISGFTDIRISGK